MAVRAESPKASSQFCDKVNVNSCFEIVVLSFDRVSLAVDTWHSLVRPWSWHKSYCAGQKDDRMH